MTRLSKQSNGITKDQQKDFYIERQMRKYKGRYNYLHKNMMFTFTSVQLYTQIEILV